MSSASPASSPADSAPNLLFPLFSTVWALNLLLYYIRFPVDEAFYLVLFLPITWVFIFPRSPWTLLAFALGWLIVFFRDSPIDSNYLTVTASLNLAILFCALSAWRHRRSEPFTLASILIRFRPLVIIIFSATYLFSVFHKLNHSFLDPETSYAVRILTSMREDDYPGFLTWVQYLFPRGPLGDQIAIWGTLAIETLIPILLIFPRTRFAGIVLDFIFHFVMGYRMYPPSTNFPCLLSASLMLLFPSHASTFLRQTFAWLPNLKPIAWIRHHRFLSLIILTLFLVPFVFRISWLPENFHDVRDFCRAYFWHAYVILYGVTLILYVRYSRRQKLPLADHFNTFRLKPRLLWALPAIFVLQCFSPHLGLKSRASAEVYSGLLTFHKKSNHLVIPPSWQIFPYLDDTVTITGPSSSGYITYLGEQRAVMPYLHFIRLARRNKSHSATFIHNGETITVEHLRDLPDTQNPPYNFFELKFLPMHHVPETELKALESNPTLATPP